jgi:parallel beta-helix repeat protein
MNRKLVLFSSLLLLTLSFAAIGGESFTVPSKGLTSISKAIVKVRPGDTILVKDGVYKENLYLKSGVVVKAINPHKAIIDGSGHGTVITLGGNSTIIGLGVTNGTIGVFNKSAGSKIIGCKIYQNWMTGVMFVRHLPVVKDNIVVFNRGTGMLGWNVRSTKSVVEHNTIAYNVGFGLYLGGSSEITFENNVVAFNQKYGLKMSTLSTKSTITANNFFENLKQLYDFPTGNYSFDPIFVSPRVTMEFQSDSKLCCSIKSSDNKNLGVRFDK